MDYTLFAEAASAESKAKAIGFLKLHDTLTLLTNVLTPIIFVVAIGLLVWALVGRLYGKVVDGERQKMSKGHFVGILVTAVVLIIVASIFVAVMQASILADNSGICSEKWSGYTSYKALKAAAEGAATPAA